jgi:hypothetical protein
VHFSNSRVLILHYVDRTGGERVTIATQAPGSCHQ